MPTPCPPLPSVPLSPLTHRSPTPLAYLPLCAPPPPSSPEVKEELPSPVLPPTPPSSSPDLLAPPWQLWTPQLGYPPYEVDLGAGPIALPYVRFGTHLGVPWQLGKQSPDGEVYA